jgi:regulator of protease activity HflC (stomatin/prohibitin superfamily)
MSLFYNEQERETKDANIVVASIVGALLIVILFMAIMPTYRVWSKTMNGKASYAEAEQNRKIAILEAEALRDSATLKAEAEVERAKGVKQSNEIIAESLKGHDEYLRYLWITNLENGEGKEVIYIPTEAGLPILEAGKRN